MSVGPPTILLVDDEFATLEVLAMMLASEGYRTITASNGEEALQILAGTKADLIITDYKMPKMDGLKLCDHLSRDPNLAKIPVILVSATYGKELSRPPQVVAFFQKPLLFARLLEAVRQVLGPFAQPHE
jgi:CheY-like chemotaxis protein